MSLPANASSTLGEKSSETELYACSVSSMKNPDTTNGKSTLYMTSCRKVSDQSINLKPTDATRYSPAAFGSALTTVVDNFFWYKPKTLGNNGDALESYCNAHFDKFIECSWTNMVEANPEEIAKDNPEFTEFFHDLIPSTDLTKGNEYACAIILCLANPKGWASVKECKPPVRKLFRDLFKGRPFPVCKSPGSK